MKGEERLEHQLEKLRAEYRAQTRYAESVVAGNERGDLGAIRGEIARLKREASVLEDQIWEADQIAIRERREALDVV